MNCCHLIVYRLDQFLFFFKYPFLQSTEAPRPLVQKELDNIRSDVSRLDGIAEEQASRIHNLTGRLVRHLPRFQPMAELM